MRIIDRICDGLAIFAGVYLVAIMFAIVIQATLRSFGFSGSSHIFTFSEYGLLYIAMAASPWLVMAPVLRTGRGVAWIDFRLFSEAALWMTASGSWPVTALP